MNVNLFSISGLIISIACAFLTIILIIYGRTKLHRIWALYNVVVVIWGIGLFLVAQAKTDAEAIEYWKLAHMGGLFISVLFLHTVCVFCDLQRRKLLIFAYSYATLYVILDRLNLLGYTTHPLFNNSLRYLKVIGPQYLTFVAIWMTLVLYGFYELFKFYRNVRGYKKTQALYFITGLIFGFSGGCTHFLTVICSIFGLEVYPFGQLGVAFYGVIVTYAILRFRLMDIKVAATRAGIFIIVYTLVLGIPFWLGYVTKSWLPATSLAVLLASLGPFIYTYLRRRAEARIRAEEQRARELLKQASEGMMRIRSIKRLVSLMVHVTCKILKLDNAAVFLLDEGSGQYKLEAVRLKSKYRYVASLSRDDALIQKLSVLEEPLLYEEVKSQAQQLKDRLDEAIHEIESQMTSLSSTVIIPATSRGQLLGFLILGEKKSKRMYSNEDLSVLWVLSNQAALAIENAQFHKKAQEALLREDREMTARFIGHGASHQFGNVLNRIVQRSSGREMDIDDLDLNSLSCEELKKIVLEFKGDFNAITNAGMQGKEIVSGILSLGAGSPVDFKQEDLKTIIQKSVQTIKLKQSKANIESMDSLPEILTDVPDTLPKIWCNSLQIEQVLDNMLDNGLEAIEEKENLIKYGELPNQEAFRGKILIKAGVNEDRIFLEILDNGIGIKEENLKNMFTPFFTTKATERLSRRGHGIGMHMVKEILKAHQGKIYVAHTEYSKGTTFIIEFPLKITENKKP